MLGLALVAGCSAVDSVGLVDGINVKAVAKVQKGNVADISIYDIYQSNGVIQVIDKVVSPS